MSNCKKCGEYFIELFGDTICRCKECPFCKFRDPEKENVANHVRIEHKSELV